MSIKTNPNNSTPAEILLSYDSGQGKTARLPEIYEWQDDTLHVAGYNPVNLTLNFLKAIFVKNFNAEYKGVADLQPILDAYSAEYLGVLHARSANSTKKTPVSNPKKVISSDEYRQNNMRQNASTINFNELVDLINDARDVHSDTDKQRLLSIINDFICLFETNDNYSSYSSILANEEADKKRFESLIAAGFTDIMRDGDKIIATISVSD